MNLYLVGKSKSLNIRVKSLVLTLANGDTVEIDWDEAGESTDGINYDARMKGLYLNGYYANAKLESLTGATECVVNCVSKDSNTNIQFNKITLKDGNNKFELIGKVPVSVNIDSEEE